MNIDARYEFLEKVGSGSFATVYRARDLELGREVAVKQIHAQYLDDPEQLDRYWQEAQLLASLQHPNIVTIYDIYRERGWLILELMQSNLAERMAGRQMDLRSLRTTVAHCLRALKYLHSRGVIHGDIKPSNMMIDARRRVKLGDFGLARRVSDEEGSLLKGTTKYMAPEVVSDEFGEIGPASDLYSLGFAAYELMCGPNFETLFPGLSAFGRNKQVAWMMWHAAADRRLPEIERVLEGVPGDLRHVVQKLCEKDQAKRYKSADDALSDLKIDVKIVNKGGPEPDVAEDEVPQKMDPERKKRLLLAGSALLASVVVCLVIILLPGPAKAEPHVKAWTIREVDPQDRALRVVDLRGKREKIIHVGQDALISLEQGGVSDVAAFARLKPGDRIEIELVKDEGKTVQKITAARPFLARGTLRKIDLQESFLVLNDDVSKETLSLRIPDAKHVPVVLNLQRKRWEETADKRDREKLLRQYKYDRRIAGLKENDEVELYHLPELGRKRGRLLTGVLFLYRAEETSGRVADVDVANERLILDVSGGRKLNLPLHAKCRITLRDAGGKRSPIPLDRVRPGDLATVKYDTAYREIEVSRGASEVQGTIAAVREATKEIVVDLRTEARQMTFAVDAKTTIRISRERAMLESLRKTDVVRVQYARGDGTPLASTIFAERPPRPDDRRVVLVGVRRFADSSLPELKYSSANVDRLRTALVNRYAVDETQKRLTVLDDPTAATMKSQIAGQLNSCGPGVQAIVYVCTHGFVVDGRVYLAGHDLKPQDVAGSGWPLDELIALMESCRSRNKVLLLDLSHPRRGGLPAPQPSTGAMLKLLKRVPQTTTVIANCSGKESGVYVPQGNAGAFASALAGSFRVPPEAGGRLIYTGEELFADVSKRLKQADLGAGRTQTPLRLPAKSAHAGE